MSCKDDSCGCSEKLKDIQAKMATKDDMAKMKDDMAKMATKDDMAKMKDDMAMMKDDMAKMATKDDMAMMQQALLAAITACDDAVLPALSPPSPRPPASCRRGSLMSPPAPAPPRAASRTREQVSQIQNKNVETPKTCFVRRASQFCVIAYSCLRTLVFVYIAQLPK